MKLLLSPIFCVLLSVHAISQTPVSLKEYESAFLKSNFALIAEQFNIDAAKAAIIQAKLWENPYLSAEINAANPQGKKVLDVGGNGQKVLSVQQLIYLGGKKKREVELARANADIAEVVFKDVLRNLRFQLRSSFYEVYYDMVSSASFESQLNNLDTLIKSYTVQSQKGNVPLKDVVRLQSLYMNLKSEQTQLLNGIAEGQSKLSLLAASATAVVPRPDSEELAAYEKQASFSVEGLQNEAIANRPDLLIAGKTIEAAGLNLQWQKALAVHDVTVGSSYDQHGGAFNNQVNLTIGIPLRLWNRNQGNIKMADIRISQATAEKQQLLIQLKSEVNATFQKYLIAKNNYMRLNGSMYENFNAVFNGVYQNFQKRNISLIEFTDFMESYNQSIIQFNQIKKSFIQACEEINYTTGTTIF